MATKRDAIRWFDARIGAMVETRQVRPDGMVWEPGPREVQRGPAGSFLLDTSTMRLTSNHVVWEADERVKVEWLDADGVTIHWTIYSDVPGDDEDDE